MKTLVALAALIIALFAWLFPFHPVGQSPFVAKSESTFTDNRQTGGWLVVISGNVDWDNAKFTTQRAMNLNYSVTIYHREGLYRPTIGPFNTKDNAKSICEKVREKLQPDAYVVDMNTWCKQPRLVGQYYECQ